MKKLKIYNSLSRKFETFEPMSSPKVGMYTCGPTVYDSVTIGNWRTYIMGDILHRILTFNDYEVDFIMNITDVGHLTGDNSGDASVGVDRMEKGATREGKTAWDIAEFYTNEFKKEFKEFNLLEPRVFARATDHIKEQIELIQKIEERGFAYKISDGIYFDTVAYEKAGNKYGELSDLDEIKEGARVAKNPEKKSPRDFALWKFSLVGEDQKRGMEWESPWGVGFPGWHIECSAMSTKYLGEQFDVHIGGEDLRSTHHPNEIAQSQSACDCTPFVKYWVHVAFLLVNNGKMGKSEGNAYTLTDIKEKGFSPTALRYLYLGGHYRKQHNFTFESLSASQNTLNNLYNHFLSFDKDGEINTRYREKFLNYINDDMATPQALALMWDLIKNENISSGEKRATLLEFDKVLGLGLDGVKREVQNIPLNILHLTKEREEARKNKDWEKSDKIRDDIKKLGFSVEDTDGGPEIHSL